MITNLKCGVGLLDSCPKCKSVKGWEWIWGKNDGHSTGYSKCKKCGAKF